MIQNHIHIGLALTGSPENAPINKYVCNTAEPRPKVFGALERTLGGATHVQYLSSDNGTPAIYEDWMFTVSFRKERDGQPAKQSIEQLIALKHQYVYFVPNDHTADGFDHTADVRVGVITQITSINYLDPNFNNATCQVLIEDASQYGVLTSSVLSDIDPGLGTSTVLYLNDLSDVDVADKTNKDGWGLAWNETNGQFEFVNLASVGGSVSALGDLTDVVITGISSGHVLYHNGTNVVNADLATAGIAPLSHVGDTANPHSVSAAQVGNSTAQWNANQIQGVDVHTAAPTAGQVLVYNDTESRLEFQTNPAGVTALLGLSDTPGAFTADAIARVNSAGDALEFVDSLPGLTVDIDGGSPFLNVDAYVAAGASTAIRMRAARGSKASPEPSQANDTAGYLDFYYRGASDWERVGYIAGQYTASSGKYGKLVFFASTDGTALTKAMELDADGLWANGAVIEGDVSLGTTALGFYGQTPVARPTVTGSRGGNAALASLLAHMDNQGLINDATTA